MNSRLTLLASLGVEVAVHQCNPSPENAYRLQTSALSGSEYYADLAALAILKPGDPLAHVAEPFNPHDKYAVRVHLNGRHIGYLPRQSNHVVSRLLRQGAPLRAEIAWIAPDLDSQRPLTLHVLWDKAPA